MNTYEHYSTHGHIISVIFVPICLPRNSIDEIV